MKTILVTSVKNEGPWIVEWIAYHISIGFSRILVYENDSDDHTDEILQRLDENGAITYIKNEIQGGPPQITAFRQAAQTDLYLTSDWCMCIDADEFFFPKSTDNVVEFIESAKGADAIAINWRNFGTGDRQYWEPGFVISRFLRCAPSAHPINRHFKCLHRVKTFNGFGIHRPWTMGNIPIKTFFYSDGRIVPESFQIGANPIHDPNAHISHNTAQINHYSLKSVEEFSRKKSRGAGYNFRRGYLKSKKVFDTNDDADDSILSRFVETRKIWLDLMADPRVGALHHASCRIHFGR